MWEVSYDQRDGVGQRSTSQTSPRRGLAIASLSRVQVEEQLLSDSNESIVAYIARFALNNLP
jgi:hypothetical protein